VSDDKAWQKEVGELYLKHQMLLAYIAWRRCNKNATAAKDLLQETMMHIIAATWVWDRVISFVKYARRVMRRVHSAAQDKADNRRLLVLGDPDDDILESEVDRGGAADQTIAAGEAYEAIRAKLPEGSYARELLRVIVEDDVVDAEEQAIALGWPVTRVYTATAMLREKGLPVLAKHGFEGLAKKKQKKKTGDDR
jgi:DNA-directed RNA polymerase specialized sigma24 family protein